MKPGYIDKNISNLFCEDVPNLGSIITLDNKGRLINSQFSKPTSSQTLLKLNVTDELPDADDLPYTVISYGDTPNIINLPYNDHNYASFQNSKNYDRKAMDYISKQTSQLSSRSNFSTQNPIRISHFNSYNSCVSQNESVFNNDKFKSQHQYIFNQQVSNTSTPIINNKTVSNISQISNIYATNKVRPGTIVINSGSVNNLKTMNVIQIRRPTLDPGRNSDTRVINLTAKKTSVLTNIMGNNQINGDKDKPNVSKTINLVPRCICGFMHDDGGMIRCEICRTWQHIVCMYPDNKFPIYYKCERCQPRDVDVKRAVTTQTNILIKTGYKPSDFLTHRDYNDFDHDNDLENKFTKSNGSHFVIMQHDKKARFCSLSESIPNTTMPIYITSSNDSQMVPPGSPRTSKRKQDLINLKTVLTKPIPNNKVDVPRQMHIDTQNSYSCISSYTAPTSIQMCEMDSNESYTDFNDMSLKVKSILSSKVQFHTNLTMFHLQYLKQNTFQINTNMYEVISLDFSQYAVMAVVEFNSDEVIMEYNGYVLLAEEYNKECDYRKHYNPYILFYDKCDRLPLCIDAKSMDTKARHVRRSCTPNAEVKHRLLQNGSIKFYVVPINKIHRDTEITIAFDYNFMKCRYPVECACKQPSCQLVYLKRETEAQSQRINDDMNGCVLNMYEYSNGNIVTENTRSHLSTTRPYKKRGRGTKTLAGTCRAMINDNNTIITPPKADVSVVRRNKRGRPPLNRATGTQRVDVISKPAPESPSINDLPDHYNDSLSENNSVPESYIPQLTIHTNFKNFKRISTNHWSLKNNRKIAALAKKASKPLNTLMTKHKVGRPVKVKRKEVSKVKKEVNYFSDDSKHSTVRNPLKQMFDERQQSDSNDEINADNVSENLAHEDEGKYWLEEINNKILKQKVKESKRVQHRVKYKRKKVNKEIASVIHMTDESVDLVDTCPIVVTIEEKAEDINSPSPISNEQETIAKDSIEQSQNLVKKSTKRGRKPLKLNNNYILSYKPSNIDDLKNDLMLITASLEKDDDVDKVTETVVEGLKEEVESTYVQETVIIEESCPENVDESDVSNRAIESSMEESQNRSRGKKDSSNSLSNDSTQDLSRRGSREDRWVNMMWQRILKNETTTFTPCSSDEKLKRRRSKGSAADGSVASEDNRNESLEIGSPKLYNSELIEDFQDSSCHSKLNNNKTLKSTNDYENCQHSKDDDDCDGGDELKNVASTLMSLSGEQPSLESNEQCGLIVYKEQHSNPMEKFSRDNCATLFSPDSGNEGSSVTHTHSGGILRHPHTKKRWLNQVLMEETFQDKSDVIVDDISDKFSSIDRVSKRSFLPPVFTSPDNNNIISPNLQKCAINPKKRLLNQFSMEDSSLPITHDSLRLSRLESNIDQTKTKLTLSEYRKRRFIDNKASNDISPKCQRSSDDLFHGAWIGISDLTPKIEKLTEEEHAFSESNNEFEITKDNSIKIELPDTLPSSSISYLETLNNLTMPSNLDPRLSILSINKSVSTSVDMDLPIISYHEATVATKREICEPKSPPDTPVFVLESRMSRNGPRTPIEIVDIVNNVFNIDCPTVDHHSESIHSFESQPSPTSDSHFDFDSDFNAVPRQPLAHEAVPSDWTSHTTSIGRMAGIKNPELLQEIEEFEDEYVPMPANLPQRSQEEIETLLLTQKRDSQIREWQEVKQIEREKVKLHHQVRSLERRLLRGNKKPKSPTKSSHSIEEHLRNYDVKDDEKTMKTFNVQLASINDQLLAQIQSVKGGTLLQQRHSAPLQLTCSFNRDRRKVPQLHIDKSERNSSNRLTTSTAPTNIIKSEMTPTVV